MTKSNQNLQKDPSIQEILTHFSFEIQPSVDYLRKATEFCQKIYKILCKNWKSLENGHVEVLRVFVSGDIGRGTAVQFLGSRINFEIIVILNIPLENPPFFSEYRQLKEILSKHLKTTVWKLNSTNLRFYNDGFRYDISIGGNYTYTQVKGQVQDTNTVTNFKSQFNGVMNSLKKLPINHMVTNHYTPSLEEYTVTYLRGQNQLIQIVIRLAKFWGSQISTDCILPGKNLLLEMVAIKACSDIMVQNGRIDVFLGFQRFLTLMKSINKLYIVMTNLFSRENVPDFILKRHPLVMDPSNPYRNLMGMPAKAKCAFRGGAERTLQRLEVWHIFRDSPWDIFSD